MGFVDHDIFHNVYKESIKVALPKIINLTVPKFKFGCSGSAPIKPQAAALSPKGPCRSPQKFLGGSAPGGVPSEALNAEAKPRRGRRNYQNFSDH